MSPTDADPVPGRVVLRLLMELAIDCARWSQLLPMLLVWGIAFVMILVLLLVGREQLLLDGLADATAMAYSLPWLGEYLRGRAEESDGVLRIGEAQIDWLLSWGWLGGSVLLSLSGAALRWLGFPVAEPRYRTRLLLVVAVTLLVALGFALGLVVGGEQVDAAGTAWVPTVAGTTVLLFVVGVWAQSAAHLLGTLKRFLTAALEAHA